RANRSVSLFRFCPRRAFPSHVSAIVCMALAPLFTLGCSDDLDTPAVHTAGGAQATGGSAGSYTEVGASAGAGAVVLGGAPSVNDPEARYFAADHVVEVSIQLSTEDWDGLRKERRSLNDIILGTDCQSQPFASPFTWKHADVTIDGTTLKDVGVRKKGFLGSLDEARPSLKIATDQFTDQDLHGVSDFTLNNLRQDPTVVSECLGFQFFARAGLIASRCNFAHVLVNGSDLGVFAHVEPIKKPFLRRHFSSDAGDLYEGTLSDFRDGWLGTFDPKTSNTDATKAVLVPIITAAHASEGELIEQLHHVIDVERFATFWATETAIAHVDGYSRNTNNFYVYRDPGTGLASLIPWGADTLFGNADSSAKSSDPIGKYTQGALANALYSSAEGRKFLLLALSVVLEQYWKEDELLAEAQRMAALVRPLLTPAQLSGVDAAQTNLYAFIGERRAALTAAIANPPARAVTLRAPACLKSIGTVKGSFATTWGTVGSANPFASGKGTLDVTFNGTLWQNLPGYVGAVAGLNPDSTADQDSQVAVAALRTDGMVSIMAFGFDSAKAVPGSLTLDLVTTPGILLQMDPKNTTASSVVGVVLGGTLEFEQVGVTDGAKVQGNFSGVLYDTPFLNGF
ncbi:MAG TPA: CotH kinase family protein, partial [Polyangiaceae bacterium]